MSMGRRAAPCEEGAGSRWSVFGILDAWVVQAGSSTPRVGRGCIRGREASIGPGGGPCWGCNAGDRLGLGQGDAGSTAEAELVSPLQ